MNGHLAAERQRQLRKIRLRTLIVHQVLEKHAERDEQAALVELADDIAAATAALDALDQAASANYWRLPRTKLN